jgi:hypothetical protein
MAANNHYPMTGWQAKAAIVPHTISKVLELGRAVLGSRHKGQDPVPPPSRFLMEYLSSVALSCVSKKTRRWGSTSQWLTFAGRDPIPDAMLNW